MAKTVRLSDKEEDALISSCLRINRELVKMGKMPLKDTEVFHKIMKIALIKGEIEVNRSGELKLVLG